MFNDEFPNGTSGSGTKAHQKGVIAFDFNINEGFYILHSVPGFPDNIAGELKFDDAKKTYG